MTLWPFGLAAAAWLAADAMIFTRFEVRHRKLRLALRHLPPSLEGKRVLHLSDLHVKGWTYKEIFVRQHALAARADLIAITGDLLSSPRGIPFVLELLEGLTAPLGVWFVPGNNEIEEIDLPPFLGQLRQLGIRVLLNSAAPLAPGAWMVGVNDPSLEKDDLDLALETVPAGAFRLLLAHSPEILYQAADRDIDWILSGHTHGGQVRFPVAGALWADTQRTGLRFVLGEHRLRGSVMHVSGGVGTSLLPVRFLCPPEILEFELTAAGACR